MREGLHPVRWAREWASSGRLSKPEGDVLKELASYAGDTPVAWPSNDTIATATQYVDKTVKAALGGLEEKGLIVRERDAIGRVLRSREHPIVMVTALVATPAAGQMQLELGDQALVTADPQPRRHASPPAAPAPAVASEDELAVKRREKIAADAAQVGATLHALNAAAEVASDDPGSPTTRGEGRQTTPEVPGNVHVQTEGERVRASAHVPAVNRAAVLSPTLAAVSDAMRPVIPEVDVHALSIDQALRAYPEDKGHDHLQAAHVVAAWIAEGGTRGAPTRLLMAALRKQVEPKPQRAGGWPPPRRRGAGQRAAKPSCAEVERGDALIAAFLAERSS